MDFPILDLLGEQACYACLVAALHPQGLRCPGCRGSRYTTRRSRRGPVLDYRCAPCGRVINAWTGTLLQAAEQATTRRRSAAAFAGGNAWTRRMNCRQRTANYQQQTAWPKGGRHERSASRHLPGPAR